MQQGEQVPKPKQFMISETSLLAPITKGEVVAYLTSPRITDQSVRYLKEPKRIPLKASQSLKKPLTYSCGGEIFLKKDVKDKNKIILKQSKKDSYERIFS